MDINLKENISRPSHSAYHSNHSEATATMVQGYGPTWLWLPLSEDLDIAHVMLTLLVYGMQLLGPHKLFHSNFK